MHLKTSFFFLFIISCFFSYAQDGIISRPNPSTPGIAYRYAISDSGWQGKPICGKPPIPPSYIRKDRSMIARFDSCNMVFWVWYGGQWDSTILRRNGGGSGGSNTYTPGSGLGLNGFQFYALPSILPSTFLSGGRLKRSSDGSVSDELVTLQELYENNGTDMTGGGRRLRLDPSFLFSIDVSTGDTLFAAYQNGLQLGKVQFRDSSGFAQWKDKDSTWKRFGSGSSGAVDLSNYFTKSQSDARYLQSYTETDAIANAKTVSINGNSQSIGSNPSFTIDKAAVGLGNVDNTSDVNKPISTATQTALNGKASQSDLNTTNNNVTANAAAILLKENIYSVVPYSNTLQFSRNKTSLPHTQSGAETFMVSGDSLNIGKTIRLTIVSDSSGLTFPSNFIWKFNRLPQLGKINDLTFFYRADGNVDAEVSTRNQNYANLIYLTNKQPSSLTYAGYGISNIYVTTDLPFTLKIGTSTNGSDILQSTYLLSGKTAVSVDRSFETPTYLYYTYTFTGGTAPTVIISEPNPGLNNQ